MGISKPQQGVDGRWHGVPGEVKTVDQLRALLPAQYQKHLGADHVYFGRVNAMKKAQGTGEEVVNALDLLPDLGSDTLVIVSGSTQFMDAVRAMMAPAGQGDDGSNHQVTACPA